MHVVIAGASGLIGTALARSLEDDGRRVTRLVRRPPAAADERRWDPTNGQLEPTILDGVDVVVNLAGAGIGDRRWTDAYRRTLVESRTDSTSLLARTAASAASPPSTFISSSAVGCYGNRGDEVLTEQSDRGTGFLADLCQAWEDAAKPAADRGLRTVALRSGVVLSTSGGVLPKMLPLFKMGLGGRLGSGDQYFSWISIDDEISAITFAIDNEAISGAVNLTAPNPVPNSEFTTTLAEALSRPSLVPVPRFAPRLLLGTARADALLFDGQRVVPRVLTSAGFVFANATLDAALSDVLGKR